MRAQRKLECQWWLRMLNCFTGTSGGHGPGVPVQHAPAAAGTATGSGTALALAVQWVSNSPSRPDSLRT
jgi:hypothetical protein